MNSEVMASRARALRYNMTPYEKKLWFQFLRDHEASFCTQKVIGPYIVDFYCSRMKLSIELDGGQHYESQGLRHDAQRTRYLEKQGIKELRFSNADIENNFEGVCMTIDHALKARRGELLSPLFRKLKNKR